MPIKRFLYIQAKTVNPDEGGIAFQHRFVETDDADDAQIIGQRMTDNTAFVREKRSNELINDYVVLVDVNV